MRHLYLFLIFIHLTGVSQTLKPSIGLGSAPSATDPVCTIPVYTGSFNNSGLSVGDTIPHFQLYDANDNAVDILTVLQNGKPVLLVAGSYTCPVFRQKIARINNVASTYAGQIAVYVIYVVEAHPKSPDPSPYSGTVWTTSENQTSGILYLQPETYGERKQVLADMVAVPNYQLQVPVLLDGPCNEWWLEFGPAPNNAYLIKPNGVVYAKHGWFDKSPDNISTDINNLLGLTSIGDYRDKNNVNVTVTESEISINRSSEEKVTVAIYSFTGQLVYESDHTGKTIAIPCSEFASGTYFFKVLSESSNTTGKIIIP